MSKIRHLIRSITERSDDYDENYIKIKFNSGDHLPLNKAIEIHNVIIVVMVELKFLKEFMLIRQVSEKSVIFVTIGFFLNKGFKSQPNVIFNHDLLIMSMNISGIAFFNIKGFDCGCIISWINKSENINVMKNNDLTKKVEHYKTWKFFITYKNG